MFFVIPIAYAVAFVSGTSIVSVVVSALTDATSGSGGEIVFDPVHPLDTWTATTGGAGEVILEAT